MTRISGGLIDRDAVLRFTFDGRAMTGARGDTLASALLANGVQLVGRSFKYHRPRGIFTAGSEEPNALITIGTGATQTPNTRATMIELSDGLTAFSQNHIGGLTRDVMAVNDVLSPFLAAGFYYKTFMWPRAFWERLYEPIIRRAAGLGRLSMEADPGVYDEGYLHPDVLIVGAGGAGLMAALICGAAGLNVVLADEDTRAGGRLLAEREVLNGAPAPEWADAVVAQLRQMGNVRIMPRTTVFGVYDHGVFGAVERHADGPVRQTLWRITAARTIVAAGAIERHIPFENNDRPGIMLSGAMRAYANRWAVTAQRDAGDPIAIFTSTDNGHRTARDLVAAGVPLAGVIDTRADVPVSPDYPVFRGATVTGSKGRKGLRAVRVDGDGPARWITAGALGVAGGWNPNIALLTQRGAAPTWSEAHRAFLPTIGAGDAMVAAGAARGCGDSAIAAITDGAMIAQDVVAALGKSAPDIPLPEAGGVGAELPAGDIWHVPSKGRAWVDFQNDVTVKDIALSHRENMRSVEHLKRWTTLGMATDQGKTANVTALALMAELTGKPIPETGTTRFRPPYTPVSLGVLGGGDTGAHFRPRRLTPTDAWARKQGAVFTEVGPWMRAQYFPRAGEDHWRETVDREAMAVRSDVGICDVSTLGKIDVQGPDAAAFLDRIYAGMMSTLAVGKVRYGLMLREDGVAYDDGTCARMGDAHFVVSTTTAQAGLVFQRMEFARQCLWPDLDVSLMSVTDAWAQIAVAGPKSRALLSRVVDDADLGNAAFPFMACAPLTVCGGLAARLFRISFSGELAYELAVPARYGNAVMERLMTLGADLNVTPYGTEALGVLRIEKGHAAGNELNGQTTAQMLGLGRMVSGKKDAIGAVMSRREGLANDPRRLVGLMPIEAEGTMVAGAHLFTPDAPRNLDHDRGWVTSACYSPHVGRSIALAYLADPVEGETVIAANPIEGGELTCRVVSPHFVDPDGGRLRD